MAETPDKGRIGWRYVVPTLVLLLLAVWPLVAGLETLFFRDVFNTHLEMKWWQNEAMSEGFVPLVDPYRSGGQAHLGNPNTVALYPTNLLFRLAPFLWAFNAHFWIHLLLAPVGMFWLGRRLGVGTRGAWAAGVFYGASGYFLSNLNLYNLVAAAMLIPAFAASVLALCSTSRRRWRLAVAAGLWCLLLLAGDPMTAAIGLGIAVSALGVAPPSGRALPRLALALGAGTLLAAPLLVEFVRILGLSFRGHWGFSAAGAMEASWHPAAILEWFVPFAFGRPDLAFWGHRFYSGSQPLFYSFYPGVFAVICFVLGVAAKRRVVAWAMVLLAVGLFLALGGHNPVVVWLASLPGLDLLRLPVKVWPMVSVPAAVVAGLGFERCLAVGGAARLRRVALALASGYLGLWFAVRFSGSALEALFDRWMPVAFAETGLAGQERLRWETLAIQFAALAMAFALATWTRPRVFEGLAPVLLAVHLTLQLALLSPLYPSEPTSVYRDPPPAALAVPEEAIAVHAASGSLFGTTSMPIGEYPSPDPRWLQRQVFYEAYPFVGMMSQRRFEFELSPEGLDSFLTRATAHALPLLTDVQRVRLLRASGVQWLYTKRELEPIDGVEVAQRFPSLGGELLLYRLTGSAAAAQFVGELVYSANMNDALATLTLPDFRPREQAVIAGSGVPGSGMAGSVVAIASEYARRPEEMAWKVESPGSGALLVQKTYLPIYRVEVDGEEITPWVANMHRLAVPLEAGKHVVRVWPDRRAFRAGLSVALLTALGLLLYVSGLLARKPRGTLGR